MLILGSTENLNERRFVVIYPTASSGGRPSKFQKGFGRVLIFTSRGARNHLKTQALIVQMHSTPLLLCLPNNINNLSIPYICSLGGTVLCAVLFFKLRCDNEFFTNWRRKFWPVTTLPNWQTCDSGNATNLALCTSAVILYRYCPEPKVFAPKECSTQVQQ